MDGSCLNSIYISSYDFWRILWFLVRVFSTSALSFFRFLWSTISSCPVLFPLLFRFFCWHFGISVYDNDWPLFYDCLGIVFVGLKTHFLVFYLLLLMSWAKMISILFDCLTTLKYFCPDELLYLIDCIQTTF